MRKLSILLVSIVVTLNLHADEGMWIPLLLEKYTIKDMQDKGFQLSAEDIYSINNASLKDAVVIFGGGCTAEVVSDKGLLLTNHHCGYGEIQSHSSIQNDYLTNGFWAMSMEDELPNPGLTVTFLEKIENVTEMVLKDVEFEVTEANRNEIINRNIEKIVGEFGDKKYIKAIIKPFYYGNEYYMFVYKEFKDVRLVGAPPSGIGNFGRDTDNWMWPRHTGDFSIFRIYADKNNQPAEYSPDNVPFKPAKFLPISIQGYQEGDFTMVMGYPGTTNQYYTSNAIKMLIERSYPQKIALRNYRLKTMEKYMRMDDEVRIQYAAKYNRVSNAWKKWQGVLTGLEKTDALEKKKEEEAEFLTWIRNNEDRYQKYGKILDQLKGLYDEMADYILVYEYANEAVLAVEILKFAMDLNNFLDSNSNLSDIGKINARDQFLINVENFFKDYYPPIDAEIFEIVLETYFKDIAKEFHPKIYQEIEKKFNGNYNRFVEKQFKKSFFMSYANIRELLLKYPVNESVIRRKLNNDPIYKTFLSFGEIYNEVVYARYNFLNQEIERAYRNYVNGLKQMNSGKMMYPDANFTMRVAYGKVEGYTPADAIFYNYESTLSGVVAKYNSGHQDYSVPEKLIELHEKKDFGKYATPTGEMNVCFIASNHTSGGNSGSPVMNASGELIGLNFDRNWEGTMSDVFYDRTLCRNISVDIRYVLFIIDKYAGAGYLLDEMDIR